MPTGLHRARVVAKTEKAPIGRLAFPGGSLLSGLRMTDLRRPLGPSALRAFPIAYGCWRFAGTDVRSGREKMEAALETGIDLFDHADIYGGDGAAEALFGRVLAEAPGLRAAMLIATKCGIVPGVPYDSSREHILRACEGSLRRLQIETIDLYQIRRPDFLGHPHEIAAAFDELRAAGKIREVGVSNYSAAQFDALQAALPFRIATHQPEFSCWHLAPLRDGVLDQCLQHGVTPLAWSPLAGGRLGQPVADAADARLSALIRVLDELAARESVPRSAIALAFVLRHPSGAIPIIGTQTPARIRECAAALRVKLGREDWYRIVVASQGERLP